MKLSLLSGVLVAVCVLASSSALADSAAPATRPASEGDSARPGAWLRDRLAERPPEEGERPISRLQRRIGDLSPPTEEELQEAITFMRQYAPRRWELIDRLPADGFLRRRALRTVLDRYRAWEQFEADNAGRPRVIERRKRMMLLEDAAFGAAWDLRQASEAERPALEKKLNDAVTRLVEEGHSERRERIAQLEQLLSAEQARQREEEQNLAKVVAARVEALIRQIQDGPVIGGRGSPDDPDGSPRGPRGPGGFGPR